MKITSQRLFLISTVDGKILEIYCCRTNKWPTAISFKGEREKDILTKTIGMQMGKKAG